MNKGQFQKGRTKTGGRKKGTPNKSTVLGKDRLKDYFNDVGYKALFNEIDSLEGYQKVHSLIRLLSFILPKAKETQEIDLDMFENVQIIEDDGTEIDYGVLTDDELSTLVSIQKKLEDNRKPKYERRLKELEEELKNYD